MDLSTQHRRRLREMWRSAGWPCRDAVEAELLAAHLLQRRFDGDGRETLHLTEAGLQVLVATRARNRAAFDAHEALVARVAELMQREGRVVWRGLSLRAPLAPQAGEPLATREPNEQQGWEPQEGREGPARPGRREGGAPWFERGDLGGAPSPPVAPQPRWVIAMPDVYSIRHTTVEAYTEPAVHEIKVRRADLLADLKRPDKGAAYRALSSQCWYVLGPKVGSADDVPAEYGVLLATPGGFELARPAPRRAMRPDFATWMALARANAQPLPDDLSQAPLRPEG